MLSSSSTSCSESGALLLLDFSIRLSLVPFFAFLVPGLAGAAVALIGCQFMDATAASPRRVDALESTGVDKSAKFEADKDLNISDWARRRRPGDLHWTDLRLAPGLNTEVVSR